MKPLAEPSPGGGARGASFRDAVLAIRNTIKLGGALVLTWAIGLAARVLLPRFLGPTEFGALNFADAFTGTAFVLLGLGLDTYARRELAVREDHASEFFGGTLVVQAFLTVAIFSAIHLILRTTDRPVEVVRLVYAFGLAQVFQNVNSTLAAMLHARGTVDHLALVNIVSKILWGLGIALGFFIGQPALGVPVSLLVTEAGKAFFLTALARRHVHLRFRLDLSVTRSVLVASLPFYLGGVASVASSRVDVSLLEFLVHDRREIGWYGAASTLARLGLILTPLLSWVLMPLVSRALARSEEDLRSAISRSTELVVAVAVPISLLLAVGADVWVTVLFGQAYAPSALALRLLGPVFVLTYMATVSGTCLQMLGKGWTATNVTILGTVVDAALNTILIPRIGLVGSQPGLAGAASAFSALITELVVVIFLMRALEGRALDRRAVGVLVRTALVCVAVVGLDRVLLPLGPARLAIDAAAYLGLAVATGAMRWREGLAFLRVALQRGEPEPTATGVST